MMMATMLAIIMLKMTNVVTKTSLNAVMMNIKYKLNYYYDDVDDD